MCFFINPVYLGRWTRHFFLFDCCIIFLSECNGFPSFFPLVRKTELLKWNRATDNQSTHIFLSIPLEYLKLHGDTMCVCFFHVQLFHSIRLVSIPWALICFCRVTFTGNHSPRNILLFLSFWFNFMLFVFLTSPVELIKTLTNVKLQVFYWQISLQWAHSLK